MVGISTSTSYNGVLAALTQAQNAENSAIAEISSGMKSTNLEGYGANAETLTAMQSVQANVTSYLGQTQIVSGKLSTQATALGDLSTAAQGVITAVTNAIGSGDGATLMQSLDGYLQDASGALNTQFNGEYLFAGGQVNTKPVNNTTLANLPSVSISSLFNNDQTTPSTQLDGSTTIQTGFLASQVGSPLFTALQGIANYVQQNGAFGATLTQAQTGYLQGMISTLNSAYSGITDVQGQNGVIQKEVTTTQTNLTNQQTTLQTMIGDITNADLAQASSNLQQAQLAVQASAQVFQSLRSNSLASLLPIA
jgi:flagellar hook-associated protein 3 FlgL